MNIVRRNRLWVLYVGDTAVVAGTFAEVFAAARAS
jgi:hypothetical protein